MGASVTDDASRIKGTSWMQGVNEFFDEHGNFVEALDARWLTTINATTLSAA